MEYAGRVESGGFNLESDGFGGWTRIKGFESEPGTSSNAFGLSTHRCPISAIAIMNKNKIIDARKAVMNLSSVSEPE